MKRSESCKLMLLGFLLSICVTCDAAIGTITAQENAPPSIQRSKTTLTGTKGTGVEMQDEVKTARGKAGITFADNTQVQVNENSRLVIDDFVYDPKKGSGQLALNMASGTVRYASGAIAKNNPSKVAINTPTATIAVRGTDFTATVDELGASTIILLPSCPARWQDVERDCKTGAIDVITDAGVVSLTKPFQATKVETRDTKPTKPVVLNLNPDSINNLLIVAPPRELVENRDTRISVKGALDVNFLKETGLVNAFDAQEPAFKDKLSTNLLDQDFLVNVLDLINSQMAAQLNLLNTTSSGLLPDYTAISGIIASVDDNTVTLSRDDGSNIQSVTVPKNQNTTIYMTQGVLDFKNRVNSGGSTVITLKQN